MVENPAQRTMRLRRLRANNPGYSTAKNRKWNAANPEKRRAHRAVGYALKVGKLVREPCEFCGASKVQAHHDDYAKPLVVRWWCHDHHRLMDSKFACS